MSFWQNMRLSVELLLWSCISTLLDFIAISNTAYTDICTDYQQRVKHNIEQDDVEEEISSIIPLPLLNYHLNGTINVQHDMHHGEVHFIMDACGAKLAAYAGDIDVNKIVLVSEDLFTTHSQHLTIPASFVGQEMPLLTSMAFVSHKLLTVINNEIFIHDVYTQQVLKATGINKNDNVTHTSSYQCCAGSFSWCTEWTSMVIAHAIGAQTSWFYFSIDSGYTFTKQLLLHNGSEVIIFASTIISSVYPILFLVESLATDHCCFLAIAFEGSENATHVEMLGNFSCAAENSHTIGILQLQSDFGSMIFWDDRRLYYKSRLMTDPMELAVYINAQDEIQLNFLDVGEFYQQYSSNRLGEFLLLTSKNRLLYGREGMIPEITMVASDSVNLRKSAAVAFDEHGDILVVNPIAIEAGRTELPSTYKSKLLLESHYDSKVEDVNECPYQSITTRDFQSFYSLDITDESLFKTVVKSVPWVKMSLWTELSTTRSISVHNHLTTKQSEEQGVTWSTMATKFSLLDKSHIGQESKRFPTQLSRVTHLRIVASPTSLTCHHSPQKVAHISFGCTPGKQARVNRVQRFCDMLRHDFVYEIPVIENTPQERNSFGQKTSNVQPTMVLYNFTKFGCPNRTFFNEPFTFDIHVYEGERYVGPMTGHYVIYEINGIDQYKYNLKTKDVNCLQPPQTWKEMRMRAGNSTPDHLIWHRGNYIDCQDATRTSKEGRVFTPGPDDDYEIMSIDNGNYITFDRNGIYLFEIIVVDKDFSFCDLRTFLAVEVYGVQPIVPIPYFFIMYMTIGTVVVTIVTTFAIMEYNKIQQINREKEYQEIEEFEAAIDEASEKLYMLSKRSAIPNMQNLSARRMSNAGRKYSFGKKSNASRKSSTSARKKSSV